MLALGRLQKWTWLLMRTSFFLSAPWLSLPPSSHLCSQQYMSSPSHLCWGWMGRKTNVFAMLLLNIYTRSHQTCNCTHKGFKISANCDITQYLGPGNDAGREQLRVTSKHVVIRWLQTGSDKTRKTGLQLLASLGLDPRLKGKEEGWSQQDGGLSVDGERWERNGLLSELAMIYFKLMFHFKGKYVFETFLLIYVHLDLLLCGCLHFKINYILKNK